MSRRSNRVKYKGREYRSNLEVSVLKQLNKLKRQKKIRKISYESTRLPYIIKSSYLPDFIVELNDGRVVVVEVKGVLDRETQRKMLAVKEANPDIEIIFFFWKDKKIRKNG